MMHRVSIVFLLALLFSLRASAYSLLTHEAIIDATWEKSIAPLLIQKYPNTTPSQLKEAHAYVYGGAIVPDIGYYPFGSVLFTHLAHYVRSGDFVHNLLAEARDVNEYAFALGVLCHYEADTHGHPSGTNRAVPLLFPELKKKYGDTVTYEEGPTEHVRTEFGFDVLQTASGNYKSEDYHNFIGFKVNQPVLERAFLKTYGLELTSIFPSVPVAVETFRFTVKTLFPRLTIDAWKARHNEIAKLNPLATKENYRYHFKKKDYKKEFGKPRLLSPVTFTLMVVLPKVGPLARFKFKAPTEQAEKYFKQSFQIILTHYSDVLKKLESGNLALEDEDLDTGKKTTPGEYKIADQAYYKLILKLKKRNFAHLTPALQKNILNYFNRPDAAKAYSEHPRRWKKIQQAAAELKDVHVSL